MTQTLTAGQASLLRATRLVYQASQAAEVASQAIDTFPVRCREFDVKCLLWHATVLLPDGLPLAGEPARNPGCIAALVEAEAELRTLPLDDYPDGITDLLVDLCDLIAESRVGVPGMIPSLALLREADHAARDVLHDAQYPDLSEPLLRGWVEVIECASGAWSAIPAPSGWHTQPDARDPLASTRAVARDINRTLPRVPNDNTVDQRTRRIAALLADISERASTDFLNSRTATESSTADAAALRAGILHTCYILTHATSVALSATAHGPGVGERHDAFATLRSRIRSAEQILDTHLHHRSTSPPDLPAGSPESKLAEALSRWDVVVHDIARTHPDPKNLAIIADVNLGLLANTGRLSLASAETGYLDPSQVAHRLLPAVARATRAWEVTRRDWAALASPQTGLSRELQEVAKDMRRALADPALAGHPGTPSALVLGLAAGQEAAILLRHAMVDPDLRAPADTVVHLTRALADRHPEQVSFATWQGLERLQGRTLIRLPNVVRQDLLTRASATVEAAAVTRSAGHVLQDTSGYDTRITFNTPRRQLETARARSAELTSPLGSIATRETRTR